MKCEACLEMIDDLIEGELDDRQAREVNAHIAMCEPCSQLHTNFRDEQELYGKYLLDVEPTPALWANLRLEMEKEKVRDSQPQLRLQRWLTIALGGLRVTPRLATALVLITIGLTIGIMVWRTTVDTSMPQAQNSGVVGVQPSPQINREGMHRESDKTDRRSSTINNDQTIRSSSTGSGNRRRGIQVSAAESASRRMNERSPATPTVDQVARRVEQEYLSAIKILSRDIKRRRGVISPALLSQLETALAEVDRNIAATRRLAREQPRDPVAVQYLAAAYENKVELLREVTSW